MPMPRFVAELSKRVLPGRASARVRPVLVRIGRASAAAESRHVPDQPVAGSFVTIMRRLGSTSSVAAAAMVIITAVSNP